jgi:hypothetical protein
MTGTRLIRSAGLLASPTLPHEAGSSRPPRMPAPLELLATRRPNLPPYY